MSVSSPLSLPSLVCCSLFEEDGRRCCGGGDTSCCFWKMGACRSSLVLLARSEDLPGTRLVGLAHQDDAVCLYVNRYQRKCYRNLRFGPLFSEGFLFL
ncbi:uncharacterized protein K444DRAFT_204241 [Hyaloscypha bicolor E]|uniref:Uncharacterized protein n=1 Tax=Hyaloscypha bicolor E TaxID=1095630 RepID=A0A2J6TNT9_9HELO|nr:uncharacterized protein K444DRAFT_204241 [Hyaloscypha bicolor E]PMD64693.1 hypothetical protein K444DRAFT_204241 [Hyaloscypha bicolor E]